MKIDKTLVSRILVIKLRAIGDVLLSTIVTKNLRLAFPDATIDFLTEPPARDIVEMNPHLDTVHVFDKNKMHGGALISLVRRHQYDLVIDLFGNPRTALVTRLSGARYRVGYRFRNRTYAYNIVVEPRGGEVHNTQFNLDALVACGVDIQDRNLYFHVGNDDAGYIDAYLHREGLAGKFLVCLNPGGGWYTKRWGLDRFAALGDRLVAEYGASVILAWGPGQMPDVESVRSMMSAPASIPPATTLRQLGALLKRCAVVISNDSGPMHIAAAMGTHVLGIYGPTNPKLQGPYGQGHLVVRNEELSCLGCNLTKCPIGHPCMVNLPVESVLEGVSRMIHKDTVS